MSDFAGALRERVEILKRSAGRDALAEAAEDWTVTDSVWAAAAPIAREPGGGARWRLTLRPCPVAMGDRIDRVGGMLAVVQVTADPATPDRITIVGEAVR